MSPNEHRRLRHARIKEILFEVSALEGSARADFLTAACGGDREMRDEVESLLSYHNARVDEAVRTADTPPLPARVGNESSGAPAAFGEANVSSPTDAASGKAARGTRRKSSH